MAAKNVDTSQLNYYELEDCCSKINCATYLPCFSHKAPSYFTGQLHDAAFDILSATHVPPFWHFRKLQGSCCRSLIASGRSSSANQKRFYELRSVCIRREATISNEKKPQYNVIDNLGRVATGHNLCERLLNFTSTTFSINGWSVLSKWRERPLAKVAKLRYGSSRFRTIRSQLGVYK